MKIQDITNIGGHAAAVDTSNRPQLLPDLAADNAFTPGCGNTPSEKAGTLQSSPPPRPTQCNLPIQGDTAADNPPGVATCSAWYNSRIQPPQGKSNPIEHLLLALARATAPDHACENNDKSKPWMRDVRPVIAIYETEWKPFIRPKRLLELLTGMLGTPACGQCILCYVVDAPARDNSLAVINRLPPNFYIMTRANVGGYIELQQIRTLAKAHPANTGILMDSATGCFKISTLDLDHIRWVVMGGHVRGPRGSEHPFKLERARDLAAHCANHGVPFFLNRLGSNPTLGGKMVEQQYPHGDDWDEWPPEAPRTRQFPRAFRMGGMDAPVAEVKAIIAPVAAATVNGPENARVKQDRAGDSANVMAQSPPPPQGPVMALETNPTVKPVEPAEHADVPPATENPLPSGDEDAGSAGMDPNMPAPTDDVPSVEPNPSESPEDANMPEPKGNADDVAEGTETSPSTEADDDAATKVPETAGTDDDVEPEPDANPPVKPTDCSKDVPDKKGTPATPVKAKGRRTVAAKSEDGQTTVPRRAAQGLRKKVVKDKPAGDNGEKGTGTGVTEDVGQMRQPENPLDDAVADNDVSSMEVDTIANVDGMPSANPGQRAFGTKGSKQHAPLVPVQGRDGVSSGELARFKELDAVVRGSREAFVEMGLALNEIHARELWKAGKFKSFEKYAREVLHKSKQEVHRLIDAACFHKLLREKPSPIGDDLPLPTHPSQVRPLDKSLDDDSKVQVWTEACKACGKGKVPTAPDVQEQKDRLFPKPKSETGTGNPDSKTQKPNRRSMTETYPELVPLFTAIRSGELEEANLLLEQIAGRHAIKLDGDTPDEPEDNACNQSA